MSDATTYVPDAAYADHREAFEAAFPNLERDLKPEQWGPLPYLHDHVNSLFHGFVFGWINARARLPESPIEVEEYARGQADHWLADIETSSRDAKHASLMAMAGNCIRYGANGHPEAIRADQQRANIDRGGNQ